MNFDNNDKYSKTINYNYEKLERIKTLIRVIEEQIKKEIFVVYGRDKAKIIWYKNLAVNGQVFYIVIADEFSGFFLFPSPFGRG